MTTSNEDLDKVRAWRVHIWRIILGASGVWVVLFGSYWLANWGHVWLLSANEFGDFIAGMFAPVAVVWIVAGYFLQSKELALQARELREQVQATRRFAESAAERERQVEMQGQPILRFEHVGQSDDRKAFDFDIYNHGMPAINVALGRTVRPAQAHTQIEVYLPLIPILAAGAPVHIRMTGAVEAWFELSFTDLFLQCRTQWFYYDGSFWIRPRGTGELIPGQGME